MNITANGIQTISINDGRSVVVGPIPKNMGELKKVSNGVVYFDGYRQVADPGLSRVSPACSASTGACNGLVSAYTNKAIVDPSGKMILVNPQPGEIGTLGYGTIRGPKAFYFDMNLVKRFQITESKTFEFRLDAINILNHPNFADPNTNINGNSTFGRITSLAAGANLGGNGGMRSFVINTRLNF